MADKGIIFSAPMVRALLDGRKSQTRRLLKPQPVQHVPDLAFTWGKFGRGDAIDDALPYAPGDRLYVREAFSGPKTYEGIKPSKWPQDMPCIRYWADDHRTDPPHPVDEGRGKPSIHMPRWASRLTLTVTEMRVQRVGEISEEDAIAEGIIEYEPTMEDPAEFSYVEGGNIWNDARSAFRGLWNSLHTKPGETWEASPWVCAVSFSVEQRNIDR